MPVYVLTYPGLKCAPWCLLICPAVCIYESISPQVSGGAPSVPALHSSGGPSVRLCLTLRPRQAVEKPPTHPPFSFFSHSSVQLMKTHLLSLFAGYCPPPHPNRITQANHSREVSCRILVSFRRGSSVGQSTLHLSPGVDVGLRERRGRMGKESAVAVTAASASVTVSSSLARNAFHLSFSLPLSAPPLYLPPLPFFLSHSLSATAPAVWIHNSARCRAYRAGTVSQRLGKNKSEGVKSRKQNKIQEEGIILWGNNDN